VRAAVDVRNLAVLRGGRTVVEGLSFQVQRGQIVGLLGPSGCGKSTLMRALVGVQQNVTGTCEVLGVPAGSASLRRRVSYMTQDASVYINLTVTENLEYFAAVLGVGRDRVCLVLEEVGLQIEKHSLVSDLSGGQRNRVSLAVALLGEPELLVLDEPTVGLDPVLRRDLWAQFRRLASRGVTLLVSSHVMEEASECDRILVMRNGQLIADDGEEQLLARTSTNNITDAFLVLVNLNNAVESVPDA